MVWELLFIEMSTYFGLDYKIRVFRVLRVLRVLRDSDTHAKNWTHPLEEPLNLSHQRDFRGNASLLQLKFRTNGHF